MAATNFTPISLYHTSTPGLQPDGANLVAGELALNIPDGKLYFKDDSSNIVLLASKTTSSNVTSVSVVSTNGFGGSVANPTTTPAITLTTTATGMLKGSSGSIIAASPGVDYAPATSGTSILYANGSGGFSSVTIGANLTFTGGTLSASGGGGSGVTSVGFSGGTTGFSVTGTNPITSTGTFTLTGTLVAANGGTGLTSPGSSGNVLTSNGSAWVSQAPGSFPSGTKMLFAQTSAPTGWTKDTVSYNNYAIRVVTGTASSGGSVDFTTAFTSQTPSGSVSSSFSSSGTGSTTATGSVDATTLSLTQSPAHSHLPGGGTYFLVQNPTGTAFTGTGTTYANIAANTNSQGGGGSHTHTFTGTAHTHTVSGSVSSSFSGNSINLTVKYLDVILATKD